VSETGGLEEQKVEDLKAKHDAQWQQRMCHEAAALPAG
jgi:hypothetical protein